ncbi:hypothetical protein SRHO_G00045170 [Serrasalmus rhombeus]
MESQRIGRAPHVPEPCHRNPPKRVKHISDIRQRLGACRLRTRKAGGRETHPRQVAEAGLVLTRLRTQSREKRAGASLRGKGREAGGTQSERSWDGKTNLRDKPRSFRRTLIKADEALRLLRGLRA